MWIQRLDAAKLEEAYNLQVQMLYPWEGVVEPPFGSAWAVVAPGTTSKHHNHQEGETYFVARGRGLLRVGDEEVEVGSGDVVYLPPFNPHTLVNTSATEELLFLTVWWEDRSLWAGDPVPVPSRTVRRTLVTAAPPTPNGDLHLGHLSGPYLAGDLIARYLRLRGVEALYAFGTDDNQSYVATKAAQMGLSPTAAADRLAADIGKTLAAARVELDLFGRPNASAHHVPLVREFFRRLHAEGHLVAREAPSPWCESCRRYLYEAHIRGRCPHCGAPSGGNCCEECGRPNDSIDLVDAACTHCGNRPVARPFTRLYFPLSRWAGRLRAFWGSVAMNARLRSLLEQVLAAGLPDVAVTHPADWGIPVPVAGFEGQTIWVWCEMAPRYLAYAREVDAELGVEGGGWERWWKSPEASVVQCFGSDNAFFYGALVPALLLAFDPEIRLPEALVMNEFYRLDGLKFSTSRRHAIWGREMLAEASRDAVRFYLAWSNPETEGTNFTRRGFEETVERELYGGWRSWLSELAGKVAAEYGGKAPATGDWTTDQRRFHARVEALLAEAASAYEPATFSPQQAARALAELVRVARRFGKAEDGWRRVPARGEERRTGVALELLAAKALAVAAAPVMPDFAERLWAALGYPGPLSGQRWEERPDWVPGGQRIGELAACLDAEAGGARRQPAA